jgi:hypothetical protein
MECKMVMAMKVCFVCNNILAMTDNSMMDLQGSLDSQKDVPGSHSEASSSLSLSGVQAVDIKVEEFSDIEDGEAPVPISVVGIKVKHEVSCMFPLRPHCEAYLSPIQNCLFSFSSATFTQNSSSLENR